ncbi:MAG: IS66 family transposase, partial [Gammaproteobacteria bacterium]|nr:IS66 family transposase [Gammaproteobacteria bacterium]
DYAPTRSQEVPVELLADYAGYLQIDGYEGYNKICAQNEIVPLGCMAHVRRKFDQALKAQGKHKHRKGSLAQQALQRIKLLYKIEKQAKHMSDEQRAELRQSRSVPVLEGLREWLNQHLPVVVKQSALGKAMHYMDKQWPRLTVYTEDGRLNIDNNLCENAIRPFVIGRKNHLFSDTVSGAKASANLYSLIETAKANGIEPYAYLKRVFTELPKAACLEDIEALLPIRPVIDLDQVA